MSGLDEAAADRVGLRIQEAMLDVVLDRGYEATTLTAVLARAGVDRAEFEARFTGLHDCYMHLFRLFSADFNRAIFDGFETPGPWRDRLRRAGYGAARWIRDHPRESAFSIGAGETAQAFRVRHLERIVDLIDAGRQEMADPDSVSRAVAEGVVGSMYTVVTQRIAEGTRLDSIEELVPEMMYLAVRPYLGHEVAKAELEIPPPPED